jgi:hypothetical protein
VSELINAALHSGGFWIVVIALVVTGIGALFGSSKGRHSK